MKEKLPEKFTERMKALLNEEYRSFEQAYSCSARKSLRICESKTTNEKFQAQAPFHVEPVTWLKNGFFYDHQAGASLHPYYRAGVYYITESSAMTPADRLPIEKGDKVLDLCAAPGGKAFAIAGKLGGTGLLLANEVNRTRAKALLYNLESTGFDNLIITNEQPANLEKRFPEYFDKILVDAPCSGEGMFRKDRAAIRTWSTDKVEQLAALQKKILASAVKMLRPGGLLMYSTCTFSPEEDEQNVSWLLNTFPEMEILEIEGFDGFDAGRSAWAKGDSRVEKAVRIWPHKMEAEGQFMALFQKNGSINEDTGAREHRKTEKKNSSKDGWRHFSKEETAAFEEFCENLTFRFPKDRLYTLRNMAYLLPEVCPGTKGLAVLRKGLLIGEFKKSRFEPSQSLAFALTADQFRTVLNLPADDERLTRYLKGETINAPESSKNGWILILTDDYPLGFGKVSGNLIKNKLLYARRLI